MGRGTDEVYECLLDLCNLSVNSTTFRSLDLHISNKDFFCKSVLNEQCGQNPDIAQLLVCLSDSSMPAEPVLPHPPLDSVLPYSCDFTL